MLTRLLRDYLRPFRRLVLAVIVLQGVHHVLHPPVHLERQVEPHGTTRIVLITRGLSAAGLRASFATAMA